MKNVFKISTIALAFAVSAISAKAQTTSPASTTSSSDGVKFSIGVDAGLPTGDFSNVYKWNIGGSVQADIPVVAKQLYVTVNAGYDNFFGKNISVVNPGGGEGTFAEPNIQLLPVKAGLKFFPVGGFYIQGDAGAAFALNKSDVGFDKSAAFIWAPQVGYQFNVGGNSFIDAGVRYQGSTDFVSNDNSSQIHFVGLRVAYGF
jgi:hypothetical protein